MLSSQNSTACCFCELQSRSCQMHDKSSPTGPDPFAFAQRSGGFALVPSQALVPDALSRALSHFVLGRSQRKVPGTWLLDGW